MIYIMSMNLGRMWSNNKHITRIEPQNSKEFNVVK